MSNNNKIVMSEQELRQSLYRIYYNDFKNSTQKITGLQSNTQNISSLKHAQFEQHLKEYFSLSFKMKKSQAQVINEVNKFTKRILREQEGDTVKTVEDSDDPINIDNNSDEINAKLSGRLGLLPYNIDASMFDLMGNLSDGDFFDQNNIQGALDIISIVTSISMTKEKIAIGALIAAVNIINRLVAINSDNQDWSLISWDSVIIVCDAFAFAPYLKLLKSISKIKPLFNVLSPLGKSSTNFLKQIVNLIARSDIFDTIMKIINLDFQKFDKALEDLLKKIIEKMDNDFVNYINSDECNNAVTTLLDKFVKGTPIYNSVKKIGQLIVDLLLCAKSVLEDFAKLEEKLRTAEKIVEETTKVAEIARLKNEISNLVNKMFTFKAGDKSLKSILKEIAETLSDFFSLAVNTAAGAKPVSKFEAFKDSFKFVFASLPALSKLTSAETKALSQFIDGMGDDLARYANLRISKDISDKVDEAAKHAQELYTSPQYKNFLDSITDTKTNSTAKTKFASANKFVPTAEDLGNAFIRGGLNALDETAQNIIRQLSYILHEAGLILQGVVKEEKNLETLVNGIETNLDELVDSTAKINSAATAVGQKWEGFLELIKSKVDFRNLDSLFIEVARPQWKAFKNGTINLVDEFTYVIINKAKYLINLQHFLTAQINQIADQLKALRLMTNKTDEISQLITKYEEVYQSIEELHEQIIKLTEEFKKFGDLFDTSILDGCENLTDLSNATAGFAKATDDNYKLIDVIFKNVEAVIQKIRKIFGKDTIEEFDEVLETLKNADASTWQSFKNGFKGIREFLFKINNLPKWLNSLLFLNHFVVACISAFILKGGFICITISSIISWCLTAMLPFFIKNLFSSKIITSSAKKSSEIGSGLFSRIGSFKDYILSLAYATLKYINIFEKSHETLSGLLQKAGNASTSAGMKISNFFFSDKTDEIDIGKGDELNAISLDIPGLSKPISEIEATKSTTYEYEKSEHQKSQEAFLDNQEQKGQEEEEKDDQDDHSVKKPNLVAQAVAEQPKDTQQPVTRIISPKIASFAINKKAENDEINYANSLFVLAYRKAKVENFTFKLNATTLNGLNLQVREEEEIALPKSIFFDSDFAGKQRSEESQSVFKETISKIFESAASFRDGVAKFLFVQTQINDGSFFNSLSNEAQVIISNYYKDLEIIILQTIKEFCEANNFAEDTFKKIVLEVFLNKENANFKQVRRLKRHKDLIFKKYQDLLDVFKPDIMKNRQANLNPNQLEETFQQLNIFKNWNTLCEESSTNAAAKKKNAARRLNFNNENKIKFKLPDDKAAIKQFFTWAKENGLITQGQSSNITQGQSSNNDVLSLDTKEQEQIVTVNDPTLFLNKLVVSFDNNQRIMAPIVTEKGIIPGSDVYDVDQQTKKKTFSEVKYKKIQNTLKLKSSLLSAVINGSFGISLMGENSYADEFDKLNDQLPPQKFKKEAAAAYATSAAPIQTLLNGAVATTTASWRIFSTMTRFAFEQAEQTGQIGELKNVQQNNEANEQTPQQVQTEQDKFVNDLIQILQQ